MKLGIISDIHSNIIAFRECMKYLLEQGCREFVFLGDFVSDIPYTRETMDYLYEVMKQYPCSLLRGNREDYMLAQRRVRRGEEEGPVWLNNSASGNLLFAYEQLEDADLDFFEQLPISFVYEKEGFPAITFCHGSPESSRELLQLGGENTKRWMERIATDYLFAAHTHYPGEFECRNKYYFNSGSCGIAIGDYGFAQCVILESVEENNEMTWKPEFIRIPYDSRKVIQDMFTSGVYDRATWFINNNIHILVTGIDKTPDIVEGARTCQEEVTGQQCVWPYIEEKYFARSGAILGIPDYGRIYNWKH